MIRYIIIIAAILAVVLLIIVPIMRPRQSKMETTLVEDAPASSLRFWLSIRGIILLIVITLLSLGFFVLSGYDRSPINTQYDPAVIEDGIIRPGQFDESGE